MNATWVLAFVITPAIVVALGVTAALLHDWDLRRQDRRRAAE